MGKATRRSDSILDETTDQQFGGPDDDVLGQRSGDEADGGFDISMLEAPKFEIAPAGIYPGFVKDIEVKPSKANNTMWVWQFQCDNTPVGKRVFFLHNVIKGADGEWDLNGLGRVKQVIAAIKPDFDFKTWHPERSIPELMLTPANVKVTVGKYNGEATNNVREILPFDDSGDDGGLDAILS
jgi:hypothetical protein